MPYPMWIPYKDMAQTDEASFLPQIRENWLEIERWSELGIGGAVLPFIVVADDGTGDFTSIKDAIDSVATSTPTVIYVKPSTSIYTDATSPDISSKQIVIVTFPQVTAGIGEGAFITNYVRWSCTQSAAFISNSSSAITMIGINYQSGGASPRWTNSIGLTTFLINCQIDFMMNNEMTLTAYGCNLLMGTLGAGGGTVSGMRSILINCAVDTNSGAAQVWSNLGHTTWTNCVFTFDNAGISLRASAITNDNKTCKIENCVLQSLTSGGGNLTVDGGDWDQITFVGNTDWLHAVFGGDANFLNTCSLTGQRVVATGNNFHNATLTVDADYFVIEGHWSDIVIDDGVGTLNVVVGNGSNPTNGVLINTNDCSGVVAGLVAVNILTVAGDRNVFSVSGDPANYTNIVAVSGQDNKFVLDNSGPPVNNTGINNAFI